MPDQKNLPLTDRQILDRDIAGIQESIRLNWQDLDRLELSPEDRAAIRKNTDLLTADLTDLLARRDRLDGKNS